MFGVFMALITGLVIVGGIKSIARVSGRIVPLMGGLYLLMGLVILALDISNVPHAFMEVVKGGFAPEAGLGALIGTLLTGVQRATFSNEAGLGSAAVSQSSVRTDSLLNRLCWYAGSFY